MATRPTLSKQLLHSAIGLVDRRVRIGSSAGVRIGDGDAAEASAAEHMRLMAGGQSGSNNGLYS